MPTYFWKDRDLGDFDRPTFGEIRKLRKLTGVGSLKDLNDDDPDAAVAVVILLLERQGEHPRMADFDNESPADFRVEYSAEELEQQAEDEAEAIEPVMRRICERIGIDIDDEKVRGIVVEEWLAAQEQGKGELPPGS